MCNKLRERTGLKLAITRPHEKKECGSGAGRGVTSDRIREFKMQEVGKADRRTLAVHVLQNWTHTRNLDSYRSGWERMSGVKRVLIV